MKKLLFVLMLMVFVMASAQGTGTVPVRLSDKTQRVGGKEYYIHIVEQGQTLFSIARAYGLKYYDAVIKTDIHLMKVGDTVWLPRNEYSVAAVTTAAGVATTTERTHYIKVEAGQTLYSISREYGVTVEQIVEANPELENSQLKAGQMLKVPPRNAPKASSEGNNTQANKPTATDNQLNKQAEEQKKIEEQKKAEEQKKIEEQKRLDEEKRIAEQKRLDEEKRVAEEKRLAEQKRLDEEKRVAEQKRLEEEKRLAEQKRVEEERRIAEQKRLEEQKLLEEQKRQAEAGKAEPAVQNEEAAAKPQPRVIVNPYPFTEVPTGFPTTQAGYYNFSTVSGFNYQVRDLQSKDRICVTVMMPLHLNEIEGISTSKFDIEQRGKKQYKVFEFVQFYEGILMALDELQGQGYNVLLNVVDVVSTKPADVEAAFESHGVANSDFIIALLVKEPFDKLAQLAKKYQVFVINPFSSRVDVVKDNPYVVKYMPSTEGVVKSMLDLVATKHRNGHLYLMHSNNKSVVSEEHEYFEEFQKQLAARKDIKYTLFDWAANGKLISAMKSTDDNVIVSIYNQDGNKNTVYATTLLNRLSSLTSHVPTLMTVNNFFLTEVKSVDYDQLQHLNYTSVTTGHLDYNNPRHKDFIDTYKTKFRTEPNTLYAGVAHDITLFFVKALTSKGAEFWRNPQNFQTPTDLLFPLRLKQQSPTGGYENQAPDIYQMQSYKLIKVN